MLAGDGTVVLDQGFEGPGEVEDLGAAVHLDPRAAEVVREDDDAYPGVAAGVAGLGSPGGGQPHKPAFGVDTAGNRGRLGTAVTFRRDDDGVVAVAHEVKQLLAGDGVGGRDVWAHEPTLMTA